MSHADARTVFARSRADASTRRRFLFNDSLTARRYCGTGPARLDDALLEVPLASDDEAELVSALDAALVQLEQLDERRRAPWNSATPAGSHCGDRRGGRPLAGHGATRTQVWTFGARRRTERAVRRMSAHEWIALKGAFAGPPVRHLHRTARAPALARPRPGRPPRGTSCSRRRRRFRARALRD